ncbi:unnamed protein product [Cylicostephanus goldi]|uniref:Uncharacterized protein n=1 Tax=Cylicostephanus goldi TaxID=71465 RepID=A0A3P6QKX8_CYLGO|nr:unnamed protein product [Cylicostephanus goldi]
MNTKFLLLYPANTRQLHEKRFQMRDVPDMQWFDSVASKRDAGYWNDCEFSPMSCLLRRRRSAEVISL